jgi:hypothetical protein
MRSIVTAIALVSLASAALAGPIHDVQTGVYAEGDYVNVVCAVVTASATYGVAIAEAPFGVYDSVWVYLGSGHGVAVGSIVNVYGVYEEYYDLTEINVGYYTSADPAAFCTVVGTCTEMPDPLVVSAEAIMADPEPYESCIVWLRDGFSVTEILTYGEWKAVSITSGQEIYFDDYWYDETVLAVDDCANWALGMWTYSYGLFKLEPFADGFPLVGCAVGTEPHTFGQIKSMFR